jgi:N-methylhydantoinase B
MTKAGERLVFDFGDSSPQAPALINCAWSGLVSGLLIAVLTQLCWDIPWSPAGVMQPIEIRSKPGTIVHTTWPAGVAKATTAGSFILTSACCATLAKLLAASERHSDRAMAVWTGAVPTHESFGVDQRGEPYGVTLLDGPGGGAGARSTRDGVDTGGLIRTVSSRIANAETYEFRYPLLYLYRRQERDSGGAGKFRGGVGLSTVYTVHDVERIPGHVAHTTGCEEPESAGIYGGYPGSTNQFLIVRDSNVAALLAAGRVPGELDELDGRLEVQPALNSTSLQRGDVFRTTVSGGGGYGDPLERDPALVRRDVLHGLVSAEAASEQYGVVLALRGAAPPGPPNAGGERDGGPSDAGEVSGGRDWVVDEAATRARREALRAARRPTPEQSAVSDQPSADRGPSADN